MCAKLSYRRGGRLCVNIYYRSVSESVALLSPIRAPSARSMGLGVKRLWLEGRPNLATMEEQIFSLKLLPEMTKTLEKK